MRNKFLQEASILLENKFGKEKSEEIIKIAKERFNELCNENIKDRKEIKIHTENKIFPCISIYEAIQKVGISSNEAFDFIYDTCGCKAEKEAQKFRKILKFAGLYRLYPRIFGYMANKKFGEKANFSAKFYDLGKKHCKFDMTKCLYKDTCTRYNCPELTKCFCHVDDITNIGLHPKLSWNRTQFMGSGAEFCDFDVEIKEK